MWMDTWPLSIRTRAHWNVAMKTNNNELSLVWGASPETYPYVSTTKSDVYYFWEHTLSVPCASCSSFLQHHVSHAHWSGQASLYSLSKLSVKLHCKCVLPWLPHPTRWPWKHIHFRAVWPQHSEDESSAASCYSWRMNEVEQVVCEYVCMPAGVKTLVVLINGCRSKGPGPRGQRSPYWAFVDRVHGRTLWTVEHTGKLVKLRNAADNSAGRVKHTHRSWTTVIMWTWNTALVQGC